MGNRRDWGVGGKGKEKIKKTILEVSAVSAGLRHVSCDVT